MIIELPTKSEKNKQLKQDEKTHEAQAKAYKLERKALDSGKTKKAEKAQETADNKARKARSAKAGPHSTVRHEL